MTCSPRLILALVSSMLSQRLRVSPVKLAVEERISPDHGTRQASERRTTDIKIDSWHFRWHQCCCWGASRSFVCVTIHQLKILFFTESDDRSQNVGKTKGRTFVKDVIVNLVICIIEFGNWRVLLSILTCEIKWVSNFYLARVAHSATRLISRGALN